LAPADVQCLRDFLQAEEMLFMKKIEVFGFIGLGLIGGTIARAVRNTIPGARIYAFDPDRTSLQEAVRDGVADKAFPVLNASFG
jgi:prephenate dehydrogenase